MTEAEKKLWYKLRSRQLGVKFRRQQQIGKYIVDFVSFERKTIIEIDGGQHYNAMNDKRRDAWFKKQGFIVLRFWNNDVIKNIDGVLQTIAENISPSPHPSHPGRGKRKESSYHGR